MIDQAFYALFSLPLNSYLYTVSIQLTFSMNRNPIRNAATCLFLLVFIACQKQISSVETITEQPSTTLPQKIIFTDWEETTSTVLAIKYDTADNSINIYQDDTTTTNQYDQLRYSYQYNADGYLIQYIDHLGLEKGTRQIVRDQANRIQYITNHDYFNRDIDTSFYTYDFAGPSLQITAKRKSDFFVGSDFIQTVIFTYKDNLLQTLQYVQDSLNYTFEYNGSMLTGIKSANTDHQTTFFCSYQTSNPENKRDELLELILGKDYYLYDLREMYFFALYRLPYVVLLSASDPHHVSASAYSYKDDENDLIKSETYRYTFNEKQLPVLIETYTDNLNYKIRIVY